MRNKLSRKTLVLQSGISFIELVVTMVIVCILMFLSLGFSFNNVAINAKTTMHAIDHALIHGRLQSLRLNQKIYICPETLSDEFKCQVGTSGIWIADSLLVYSADSYTVNVLTESSATLLDRISIRLGISAYLFWNKNNDYIAFYGANISASYGTLCYISDSQALKYITISSTGRITRGNDTTQVGCT